ncbi:MAG: hypothetical protein P4M12_09745 [Gammaproteobacteria bacterium]|nr:hypothetical protein [Gammaproteobacteria bacterium]
MINKKMFLYVFIVLGAGAYQSVVFGSDISQSCAAQVSVPTGAYNFTVKNNTLNTATNNLGVSVVLFADPCPTVTSGTPSITASVALSGSAQICSPCFSDLRNGNFGGYFMLPDGTQQFVCIADYPTAATQNDTFVIVPNDCSSTNCPVAGPMSNQASGLPDVNKSNPYIFKNSTTRAAGNCSSASSTTTDSITAPAPASASVAAAPSCSAGSALYNGKCTPCQTGAYAAIAGATTCTSCPSGQVALTGSTSCTPCAAGQAPSSDSSSCVACPANFISKVGDAACTACPANYSANDAATACDPTVVPIVAPTPTAIKPIVPVVVVPQPVKPKVIVAPTTTITVTNNVPSPITKIQVQVICNNGITGPSVTIAANKKPSVVEVPANCTSPHLVVNGIYGTYVDPTKKMSSAAESAKLVTITPQEAPIVAGHNKYTVSKKSISYTPGSGGIIFNIQ